MSDSPPPKRRRKTRRLLILVALSLGVFVFHKPLLAGIAGFLTLDSAELESQRWLAVDSGDRRFEFASKLNAQHGHRILLFSSRYSRLNEDGIAAPKHEVAKSELVRLGVNARAITVLGKSTRDQWEMADHLTEWFAQHPHANVTLVVNQFRMREFAYVLQRALDEPFRRNVRVHGLKDRRFGRRDWWQARSGLKAVVNAYLSLGTCWIMGRPTVEPPRFDPNAYERKLLDSLPLVHRQPAVIESGQ